MGRGESERVRTRKKRASWCYKELAGCGLDATIRCLDFAAPSARISHFLPSSGQEIIFRWVLPHTLSLGQTVVYSNSSMHSYTGITKQDLG